MTPFRIAILAQEEPQFLGPFLRSVIARSPERVAVVFLAGNRSGGEPSRRWRDRWESLQTYWRILEPAGFVTSLFCRLRFALLGSIDPRSVAGAAREFEIPLYRIGAPNSESFHRLLRESGVDLVLHQSERILRPEVIAIPRLGFLNRHASLLPRFRGRLASFWSHAEEPPEYGITFHLLSKDLDAGPLVLQRRCGAIDPRWPYPRVMKALMQEAADHFWEAVDVLEKNGIPSARVDATGTPLRFPRPEDALRYQKTMRSRRST